MSHSQKALDKLLCEPPPPDFSWDDLVRVLTKLGYRQLPSGRTGGSRRKFYNQEKDALICCHQPHPRPHVDRNALREIVEHLRANKLI